MRSMSETVLAGSGKDMVSEAGSPRAEAERLKDGMEEHIDTVEELAELLGLDRPCREEAERCRQLTAAGELAAL